MAQGRCRSKNGWLIEDSVCLRYDDGREIEIPASHYEIMGYQPPLDELDWCGADPAQTPRRPWWKRAGSALRHFLSR